MQAETLEQELKKTDMVIVPGENISKVLFRIIYCDPKDIHEYEQDGIAAYVERVEPDKLGVTGTAPLKNIYAKSIDGLSSIREEALVLAKQLYGLDELEVVEAEEYPWLLGEVKPNTIF